MRVNRRYSMLDAYPRLFARFKMRYDPMFAELPVLLTASEGARSVMDIGCGFGIQTAWLLEYFPKAEIESMDPDPDRVHVAEKVAGNKASITIGAAPDIPAPADPADLVVMLDIAHYLDDRALGETLGRLYDCLKEKGRLIIRVTVPPERGFPVLYWMEELRLRLTRVPSFYRTAGTWKTMLDQAGFEVEQTGVSGGRGELNWFIAVKPTR